MLLWARGLARFFLIVLFASSLHAQDQDTTLQGNFFQRLYGAYKQELSEDQDQQQSAPAPTRIPPPALDAPPFPNAYWTYGGSSVIGATNTTNYPLMRALTSGKHGDWWKDSRIQIYGWINPGFNFSTSKHSLLPEAYNFYANRLELDQLVTYVERVPDTVQTGHWDWGFRVGNMYGIDYHFTTAKGWFSQQLLQQGRQYGDDPLMVYFDLYDPHLAKGLNIRVGRYISVPDIEAQLAVNNYTYSHSLLFSYDPFTQTGVMTTLRLNDHLLFNLGVSAGNDIAPWARGGKPSLTACVSYTFRDGKDNLYPCVAGINSGRFAYNNVQLFVNTWYHKFTPHWHMATETYYEYMRDVPAVGGPLPTEPNANGAQCSPGQIRCFAPVWAGVNYLQHEFSKKNYISIRNEFFDDKAGQRTGFKSLYSEHAIMWGHWISDVVTIRPELRWEHAYDAFPYDNGTRRSQLTFAMDLIWRY